MCGLGRLAAKYEAGVQTHLVESLWEAAEAVRMYPECGCDTGIYEQAGLLGHGPLLGAHFIYPQAEDIRILKKYDGYAVQCPDATINVIAGIMSSAALADAGIKLGYGSDIAGGHNLGIFGEAARSVQLSKIKTLYEPENNKPISFARAFHTATKGGGAVFGRVGSLEPGYQFDALVIGGVADPFAELTPVQMVERFCYLGETGNIHARYLAGKKIGD